MSILSVIGDLGEFFAGTKKVELAGTVRRDNNGLLLQNPQFDFPNQQIRLEGQDLNGLVGKQVTVHGRVLKPKKQAALVLEPTKIDGVELQGTVRRNNDELILQVNSPQLNDPREFKLKAVPTVLPNLVNSVGQIVTVHGTVLKPMTDRILEATHVVSEE
jgi:hypothetical protein